MPPSAELEGWARFHENCLLWHGCLSHHAEMIQHVGVDPTRGRRETDFGRGFYLTTRESQAREWALKLYARWPIELPDMPTPTLLRFLVPRDELARLESLVFIRSDAGFDPYWEFVARCRTGELGHLHPGRFLDDPDDPDPDDPDASPLASSSWYDIVCGPVAWAWPPTGRAPLPDYDQFSFHTPAACRVLSRLIRLGEPWFQRLPVPLPKEA